MIEDTMRREAVAHHGSQAFFWRTAAGAEVDLVIERGARRFAVEVKTGRGDHPRIARGLQAALADLDAERGWIVDQAEGIDRLGPRIARGGFEALLDGTP